MTDGELPELYNLAAKVIRVKDADTFVFSTDLAYELERRTHTIRPLGIDAAETYRPESDAERKKGEQQTEWARHWFETARANFDGEYPLIFDSREWKTDAWERSLGYIYRRHDGAEYTEAFLDEWGAEYLYTGD